MTVSIPLSILSPASDQPSSHFNAVSPVSSPPAPDECVLPTINLSGLTSSLSSQSLYHNSLESPNSSLLSTGESFILPTCETVFSSLRQDNSGLCSFERACLCCPVDGRAQEEDKKSVAKTRSFRSRLQSLNDYNDIHLTCIHKLFMYNHIPRLQQGLHALTR